MSRYKHSGWFNESVRHSLARKGIKTRVSLQAISGFSPQYNYPFQPQSSFRERVPVADWKKGRKGDSLGHAAAARGVTEKELQDLGIITIEQLDQYFPRKKESGRRIQEISTPKEEIAPITEEEVGAIGTASPTRGRQLPLQEEVPSTIMPEKKDILPEPSTYIPQIKRKKPKIELPPSQDVDYPVGIDEHREEYSYG